MLVFKLNDNLQDVIDAIYVHIINTVCMYVSILYRKAFNYNNEIVDGC